MTYLYVAIKNLLYELILPKYGIAVLSYDYIRIGELGGDQTHIKMH